MIVVDTCVIIWDALHPESLSKNAKEVLHHQHLVLCEISFWEIAMLIQKKRLDPGTSYQKFIQLVLASNKYQVTGITPHIAEVATQFKKTVNHDPADRIIWATAKTLGIPLLTPDKNLRKLKDIETIW